MNLIPLRVSNGEQVPVDVGPAADSAQARVFADLWKRVMVRWLREGLGQLHGRPAESGR